LAVKKIASNIIHFSEVLKKLQVIPQVI